MKPIEGKWKIEGEEIIAKMPANWLTEKDIYVDHPVGRIYVSERFNADINLIITAVNACKDINPTNPLAVAEALPKIVTSLEELLVYCRGNMTSQLEGLVKQAEQALNKVKGERG